MPDKEQKFLDALDKKLWNAADKLRSTLDTSQAGGQDRVNDGIKDKHRRCIIAILAANSRVEKAVLFGSRAMGTFTTTSDVDLALFGDELTITDQARLGAKIERLPMAQQVDLLLYGTIDNEKFRAHQELWILWKVIFSRESIC